MVRPFSMRISSLSGSALKSQQTMSGARLSWAWLMQASSSRTACWSPAEIDRLSKAADSALL